MTAAYHEARRSAWRGRASEVQHAYCRQQSSRDGRPACPPSLHLHASGGGPPGDTTRACKGTARARALILWHALDETVACHACNPPLGGGVMETTTGPKTPLQIR